MRTAEELELQKAGEEIVRTLSGRRFGSTEVLDGTSEVRPNADGDISVFVTLALSEPSQTDGAPWPSADLRALSSAFQDEADRLAPPGRTYLWMRPQSDFDELDGARRDG